MTLSMWVMEKSTRFYGECMKTKTIVVTGVSSGIGWGIAHALLREGHNVIGLGRNPQKIAELQEACKEYSGT